MVSPLPLIERVNALPIATFSSLYLSTAEPCLNFTHPRTAAYYSLSLHASTALTPVDSSACFDLIATTSASTYAASSLGWHPHQKRKEMRLPDLRYFLVKNTFMSPPEGFLSFMPTYEDGKEVIYVYELHLAESLRGGGMGRHLMEVVESIGAKMGVEKAMLTVFVANSEARSFYECLGYGPDESSPKDRRLRGGIVKAPDYIILSKILG
ncbi:hypothetical protein MMC13_000639 [Lambiella insularis]|nr:hypothetical protein [Lambiella insularis]